MAGGRTWTSLEDAVLAELYPIHGPSWDGWPDTLPGRSAAAALNRAQRLGLRVSPELVHERRSAAAVVANARRAERAGLGRQVMLADGLPPSAIDARLGLDPGTARRAISDRWRRTRLGLEEGDL